jgi:ribonuclease BN (tRNA processing enzyme)
MVNKVIVLGSGTCVSSLYNSFDFRNPPGHLLQHNGINILLDCGEGMRAQMNKLKFDYFNLDCIFITHFHPDHFNLDSLIQSFYVRARKSGAEKTLIVYGPKSIREKFEVSWNDKHVSGAYEKELLRILDLKFVEYENEKEINILKDVKAIPYSVCHGEMNAYALKFQLKDKIISYSGDSGVCNGIRKASTNADFFICEAAIDVNDNENNLQSHLSCFTAGEIAKKSNVKKIALVHYLGKDQDSIMKKEVEKSGFNGEINIVKDLDSFEF